ncbi:MAG: hypothetical protein N2C14_33380, partial [Planctomycetales bacterium]
MSPRTIIVIVLALVFGLSAAVLVHLAINHGPVSPNSRVVKVVVAKQSISVRSRLTADDLTTREFPSNAVPPNALTSIENVENHI